MIIIMEQTMAMMYKNLEEFKQHMHLYEVRIKEKVTYFIKKE